jgi:pyruvate dehydrogenase E1 component alpha subunit/2-oxoisovalerate dehydrogenase E1 component alpha subunit
MRGDAVAVLALFDERADATGDLHNALNFAGVFRVPCVFLCRRFPESPSRASASHATVGADSLALSYGIASASVDGTDALAVLTVVRAALARARAGRGAVFIEAVMAEPPTPDEIEKVVADSACEPTGSAHPSALPLLGAFDPLRRLRAVLEAASRFDLGADAASLDAQLMAIDRAFLDAEGAGDPDTASLFDDVYAEVPGHLRAQKESATWRK